MIKFKRGGCCVGINIQLRWLSLQPEPVEIELQIETCTPGNRKKEWENPTMWLLLNTSTDCLGSRSIRIGTNNRRSNSSIATQPSNFTRVWSNAANTICGRKHLFRNQKPHQTFQTSWRQQTLKCSLNKH